MTIRALKLELFHIYKAYRRYHQGRQYVRNRFFLAKTILRCNRILETPITRDNLSVHTMLGHPHLLMALWSLASFYAVSRVVGKLYLHHDGTLTRVDAHTLRTFFPHAEIIGPRDALITYAAQYDAYPRLKKFRQRHADNFFQTKLIDPYIISDKEYRLIFDIDVLWFAHPALIQHAIDGGAPRSYMMIGVPNEKNIDHNAVYFKDGSRLSRRYALCNGGIMLYYKKHLPEGMLADYLERLDMTRPESQHWVEQAGYASTLQHLLMFPTDQYTIKGKVDAQVVARHYTGPRRVEFYTEGLPKILDLIWKRT